MKIQKIFFLALLIALSNGCAYFSNVYERPKEHFEYNYYNDFYDLPLETTTNSIIMIPYISFLSATTEPIDKLYYNDNPKISISGVFYLILELPLQTISSCSTRVLDKGLFSWWLSTCQPDREMEFMKTGEGMNYFRKMQKNSPYIYNWL
jgi:hypothetical protein